MLLNYCSDKHEGRTLYKSRKGADGHGSGEQGAPHKNAQASQSVRATMCSLSVGHNDFLSSVSHIYGTGFVILSCVAWSRYRYSVLVMIRTPCPGVGLPTNQVWNE